MDLCARAEGTHALATARHLLRRDRCTALATPAALFCMEELLTLLRVCAHVNNGSKSTRSHTVKENDRHMIVMCSENGICCLDNMIIMHACMQWIDLPRLVLDFGASSDGRVWRR